MTSNGRWTTLFFVPSVVEQSEGNGKSSRPLPSCFYLLQCNKLNRGHSTFFCQSKDEFETKRIGVHSFRTNHKWGSNLTWNWRNSDSFVRFSSCDWKKNVGWPRLSSLYCKISFGAYNLSYWNEILDLKLDATANRRKHGAWWCEECRPVFRMARSTRNVLQESMNRYHAVHTMIEQCFANAMRSNLPVLFSRCALACISSVISPGSV